VDESTRSLLRRMVDSAQRVGSANDLHDRGFPDDARELREGAQREIAAALAAASPDDRDRLAALFGPELAARCDAHGWHRVFDYGSWLLERDPELPADLLRERQARFEARIADLAAAHDVLAITLRVRYPPPRKPWMANAFRAVLQERGEPLGSYRVAAVTYELDLAGDGLRCELRKIPPEPCHALVGGVLVHAELDARAAHAGTSATLRSRDREALERTARELRAALAAGGWVELGVEPSGRGA
jgi:hypothetical protein